jgi:hypothetical protein
MAVIDRQTPTEAVEITQVVITAVLRVVLGGHQTHLEALPGVIVLPGQVVICQDLVSKLPCQGKRGSEKGRTMSLRRIIPA